MFLHNPFSANYCLTTRANVISSTLTEEQRADFSDSRVCLGFFTSDTLQEVWRSSLFGRRGTPCLLPPGSCSKSDPPESRASCTDPQHLGEIRNVAQMWQRRGTAPELGGTGATCVLMAPAPHLSAGCEISAGLQEQLLYTIRALFL